MENFNAKRFGAYLVSDIKYVWSRCWISLAVVSSMPLIQYFFNGLFRILFGESWSGQGYPVRMVIFAILLVTVCLVFPAKAYGHVTDRRSGSDFVLIPVSTLEKTLSMLINACILIPAVFLCGYGLMDYIICLCDSSCGAPVFDFSVIRSLVDRVSAPDALRDSLIALLNPAIYIDDVIQLILIFLLGAVCFKRGKVSKTILSYIVVSMVISMIFTPIMMSMIGSLSVTPDNVDLVLEKFKFIITHPALVDTISDTVTNLALSVAIFFRVKKIKF